MTTLSEDLFAELCHQQNLAFRRVPVEVGRKTPDYVLHLSNCELYVEVKQVNPNEEDLRQFAALDRGETAAMSRLPGQRLRAHLQEAADQLRRYSLAGYPGIVVTYDHTGLGYLDSYDVLTAMFGLQNVILQVPKDKSLEPEYAGSAFGAKRTTTRNQNTSISAVGVLYRTVPHLVLDVYHNRFARVPLGIDVLRAPGIRHFAIPDSQSNEFLEWEPI